MNFPNKAKVLEYHIRLIDRFGGSQGIRDEGALESALMAVENRFHYEDADVEICAATYAFHLSKAHAFIDGNKRIAAAMAELFLKINGARLMASDKMLEDFYMRIAAGEISRDDAEEFFKE
ncbi:MAG: type II toxin-antitoxin system death-on-curing family toxin [Blastocatellales bacterium]